jgi:hypothetical protein
MLVTNAGVPYRFDNSGPILYRLDQGSLGRLTGEQASELARRAFALWQGVETASLTFEEGPALDLNVTGENIGRFLQDLPEDVTPVLFDHDGTITDAFFGAGASRSAVAVGGVLAATGGGQILQGIVVINGRAADGLFDPDDPDEPGLLRSVARAVGQMLNVGSSDLNDELLYDGDVTNNGLVPVMSPFVVGSGPAALTLDDRISVSTLYPSDLLAQQTGVIRGRVLLADGKTGLQGIAVVGRKVGDTTATAVSAISGSTFRTASGDGSPDPNLHGAFELRVPPGDYTVEIRPLRAAIGPLESVFPLPGGPRFYQATPSADPTKATPVTVTAGQTAEIAITAAGAPAPEPQGTNEVEPNDSPFQAPYLPLSVLLAGDASGADAGTVVLDLGRGIRDDIEDLYRIEVKERSIVTLLLTPEERVDLDLHVMAGVLGGAAPPRVSSGVTGGDAEALQLDVDPGTYTIGVSARDGATVPPRVGYTLAVTTTPLVEPAAPPIPVLQSLVVGNVTANGAEVRWTTDRDATGDVLVSLPRRQFGDATVGRSHRVTLANLTPGAQTSVIAVSQAAQAARDFLIRAFFQTAGEVAVTGPPRLAAPILGVVSDPILEGETPRESVLVLIGIPNSGGDAREVLLTTLTPSAGWKLAETITTPFAVGGIGGGGAALVAVRLLRDGTGGSGPSAPLPFASVTGEGTFAGLDGTPQRFPIGR